MYEKTNIEPCVNILGAQAYHVCRWPPDHGSLILQNNSIELSQRNSFIDVPGPLSGLLIKSFSTLHLSRDASVGYRDVTLL